MRAAVCLALALGLCPPLGGAPALRAQDVGPLLPETGFNRGSFRFSGEARATLHALWEQSVSAHEERVACLGGYRRESIAYITRVRLVDSRGADSMRVGALASLHECRPPEWLGTVHTHIARFDGQPYIIFSKADRVVIALWHRMWRQDGVFCLLYSDFEARCEAGYELADDAYYAYRRGNNLVH